ncbi:MAG: GNAT family N-acetyltransferase [Kiritimatiellae bacterium]|nr:GNAT family N-acetyltransferase [Kiritimatiellia bacterium]
MKDVKLKDGRKILLREMTKQDILPGGNGRCPVNCKMVIGGTLLPTDNFRILNEEMIKKYGTTAILAIDQDVIAGFVNFYPTWCPHFDLCQDEQINEAMIHLEEIRSPPPCDDPALHVRCLMVRKEYRGNHLSITLLNCLKDWAKSRGWKKIVGGGNMFSGRAQYQWLIAPKPPKPIWEKAGFVAKDFPALGLKAMSDREGARLSLEWYKSDGFPKQFPKDVNPEDPDWPMIFADYTMVCEL